jgi:hypothetical protein
MTKGKNLSKQTKDSSNDKLWKMPSFHEHVQSSQSSVTLTLDKVHSDLMRTLWFLLGSDTVLILALWWALAEESRPTVVMDLTLTALVLVGLTFIILALMRKVSSTRFDYLLHQATIDLLEKQAIFMNSLRPIVQRKNLRNMRHSYKES